MPVFFYESLPRSAIQEEKRELLEIVCANLTVKGKNPYLTTILPFYALSNRDNFNYGDPTEN